MRPLAAMANERLLRLHFSQFRSLPIKNNTDAIVLPSPVVTTQGENRLPPSGAGADFSFASSDFKTLGAFFCNFPSLDRRRLQSRRRVGQRERRAGAGEAARARSPVCSSRRRGFRDSFSVSSDFNALQGGKFPSGPSRRIRQRSCGSQPQRTVSRARVPDVVAPRLPRPYHSRARIQSFQAVAAPFPGEAALPAGPLSPRSRRATRRAFGRPVEPA